MVVIFDELLPCSKSYDPAFVDCVDLCFVLQFLLDTCSYNYLRSRYTELARLTVGILLTYLLN